MHREESKRRSPATGHSHCLLATQFINDLRHTHEDPHSLVSTPSLRSSTTLALSLQHNQRTVCGFPPPVTAFWTLPTSIATGLRTFRVGYSTSMCSSVFQHLNNHIATPPSTSSHTFSAHSRTACTLAPASHSKGSHPPCIFRLHGSRTPRIPIACPSPSPAYSQRFNALSSDLNDLNDPKYHQLTFERG